MAAAGLMTWFTTLIIVVRFMPHRIGPTFFRLVNATFGLILLAFAAFCARVLSRHFLAQSVVGLKKPLPVSPGPSSSLLLCSAEVREYRNRGVFT